MSEDKLSSKARQALKHIRNALMHHSQMPSVRELMKAMNYRSPRSAALLLGELEEDGFLEKKPDGSYRLIRDLKTDNNARTVSVPLVGTVTCGAPMLAEENIQAMIPVSVALARSGWRYFLLKAKGDSMNLAGIDDGNLILVRQQPVAENGQNVVALIDDEATVKEYQRKGDIVMLLPRSSNPSHQPIILTHDFQIQGIVIATIPKI